MINFNLKSTNIKYASSVHYTYTLYLNETILTLLRMNIRTMKKRTADMMPERRGDMNQDNTRKGKFIYLIFIHTTV